MKKLIIGALSLTLFISAANAQDNSAQGEHRGGRQELIKQLNLTQAQTAKFKALQEQERSEMKALRENKQDGTDWRSAMQQIHQKYQPQFEAILSPEQRTQFSQLQAQRGNGHWQGRDHKDGDNGHERGQGKQGGFGRNGDFAKELNLSDAQQTQMQQLREQMRPKMEAIRSNTSLNEDQKKDQMQELRKSQMEQMKSILTPGQQQKMQSLRKERRSETK